MTDEEWNKIGEIYKKEFPEGMAFDKVSAKLDSMNEHPYIQELRSIFCNLLIGVLTEGYIKYDDKTLGYMRILYSNWYMKILRSWIKSISFIGHSIII